MRACPPISAQSATICGRSTPCTTRTPPTSQPDVEMWLSLAAGGRDIRLLGDSLARVRLRPDSMTHEPSAVEGFESRLAQAFIAVGERHSLGDARTSRNTQRCNAFKLSSGPPQGTLGDTRRRHSDCQDRCAGGLQAAVDASGRCGHRRACGQPAAVAVGPSGEEPDSTCTQPNSDIPPGRVTTSDDGCRT